MGFSDWIGHSLSPSQFHNRAMDRDQTGRSALFATLIAISFRYRSSRPGSANRLLLWLYQSVLVPHHRTSLRHFRRRAVLGCFTISKFTLAPSSPVSVASPEWEPV